MEKNQIQQNLNKAIAKINNYKQKLKDQKNLKVIFIRKAKSMKSDLKFITNSI